MASGALACLPAVRAAEVLHTLRSPAWRAGQQRCTRGQFATTHAAITIATTAAAPTSQSLNLGAAAPWPPVVQACLHMPQQVRMHPDLCARAPAVPACSHSAPCVCALAGFHQVPCCSHLRRSCGFHSSQHPLRRRHASRIAAEQSVPHTHTHKARTRATLSYTVCSDEPHAGASQAPPHPAARVQFVRTRPRWCSTPQTD